MLVTNISRMYVTTVSPAMTATDANSLSIVFVIISSPNPHDVNDTTAKYIAFKYLIPRSGNVLFLLESTTQFCSLHLKMRLFIVDVNNEWITDLNRRLDRLTKINLIPEGSESSSKLHSRDRYSQSRVNESNSSDILTSGLQLVPVSTITSAVPPLIDTKQFPQLDSHYSGAPPFQDKQADPELLTMVPFWHHESCYFLHQPTS